jgi:hypothetical protein
MTVVNNSAPHTHPNDKLRYIPKSGMSRDHTRTGSRRSRCLGGVAEVRPCETGWFRRSLSIVLDFSPLELLTVTMTMYQVSKSGRTYQNGKATGDDLRRLIIDKCLAAGGDRISGHLPTTYTAIANKVLVTANTVSKIWRRFCTDMTYGPLQHSGDFCSKLSARDLELIETLKNVKGSMSL